MSKNLLLPYPIFVFLFAFFCQIQPSFAINVQQLSNLYPVDKDLISRGNLQLANKNQVNYHYEQISLNGKAYQIGIFEKQPIGKVRYLVVHDSEDASFDSGLQSLVNHGGRMVVLENHEKRGLYDQISQSETKIDPNRIFFYDENNPLDEQDLYLFSQYILEKLNLKSDSLLLALHNNSRYSRFGLNFIDELGDMRVACRHDREQKNLFWFTQNDFQNFDKNQLINNICQNDFNVVVENVGEITDKSLSNFTHFHNIDYVNIEIKMAKKGNGKSEMDAENAQIRYINFLLKSLEK